MSASYGTSPALLGRGTIERSEMVVGFLCKRIHILDVWCVSSAMLGVGQPHTLQF